MTAAGSVDGPALRDALANLKDVEVLTGKVTYAGTNRMPIRDITIVEIQDGKRAPVVTAMPDPADVPKP